MEDLQGLLEKINRDGVEKAKAESARIVGDAEAKAAAIVKAAEEKAAQAKADAEKAAADYRERAAVTMKQAARDVVIEVRESVTRMLEGLLAKGVDAALGDTQTAVALVADAVRGLAGPGEVVAGAKLAAALKAQAAALKGFAVVTDDAVGAGFSVRTDGGRVEHDFSDKAIADELAKRLRPDLAKLVRE